MADIRNSNTACVDSQVTNTIEVVTVAINDQLSELNIEAFACGTVTEVQIWVGDAFINNETPYSFTQEQIWKPAGAGFTESEVYMDVQPEQIGITKGYIDDFIVVGFTAKRCWQKYPYDPALDPDVPVGSLVPCTKTTSGPEDIYTEPGNPEDQDIITEEARVAVASYASIYPALIHKIMAIDGDCTACSDMNDALILDMLIKACSVYLTVDRVEEAWDAYEKAQQMSQDYEDLFRKGPTACQTLGGIGCWIVDKNFVVSVASQVI